MNFNNVEIVNDVFGKVSKGKIAKTLNKAKTIGSIQEKELTGLKKIQHFFITDQFQTLVFSNDYTSFQLVVGTGEVVHMA